MQDVVIYGAGGFAREVEWLIECCSSTKPMRVVCFVDDRLEAQGQTMHNLPIMSLAQAASLFAGASISIAIGNPAARERLAQKSKEIGFLPISLIHPNVERSKWIKIDEGAVICAGTILTTDIQIGRQVQINLDCTIGHDVVFEDHVTLAPGVHVSGNVLVKSGVYIGTGAAILNGQEGTPIIIETGSVVGAGAVVTRNVPPSTTVVGVPAKPLAKDIRK